MLKGNSGTKEIAGSLSMSENGSQESNFQQKFIWRKSIFCRTENKYYDPPY